MQGESGIDCIKKLWLIWKKLQNEKMSHCGSSKSVIRIVYGMPGFDLQQEELEGKIMLGGCCVTDDDPDWHCKECKHEWSDSFSKKERLR